MPVLASFMVPHPPLIVPEVGRGGEKEVELTIRSYEKVADEIAKIRPETIVITSPHSILYGDYFHISPGKSAKGSFASFRAPSVKFFEEYDGDLVDKISEIAYHEDFPCGTLGEEDKDLDHGTMVPLWFIRNKYKEGKIVRIGLSGLPLTDHYKLGTIIARAVNALDRKVVFVASGDLSHKLQDYGPYGFAKEGPEYDERIMDVMGRAAFGELFDFDEAFCDKAAECGHRSFVIMAGAWDGKRVKATAYSHEDVTGVGYGICSFYPEDVDDEGKNADRKFLAIRLKEKEKEIEEQIASSDEYVRLARKTIETYIRTGEKIRPAEMDLPSEMKERRAGAFVSIHKQGLLRGCIGTIGPTMKNLAQEIVTNAISASTRDPRFDPIRESELPWLEINVDVLGEAEDIDSIDQLDVKRYGVIVSTRDGRRGLLLPDLDGVDTPEEQVSIAMRKGGIQKHEKYFLQRFEVVRHI
ncbi:MAG: AmmeMemoRadiSam system protein A [Clostridiales bacterium]|nr:AmmeMemoRadiSam system protein A [Clostridiales bacterium]MBR6254867.1 AmmeMemoRadiSam system protein A [Clostridiales bacterium]